MARVLSKNVVVSKVPYGEPVALSAGQVPPEWALEQLGDHVFEEEDGGYAGMKVADLKAEIAKRNDGRDEADLVSAEGNKADLVAALEADDAK